MDLHSHCCPRSLRTQLLSAVTHTPCCLSFSRKSSWCIMIWKYEELIKALLLWMSSSSVSPRTPCLPSSAAPNTDVSVPMPNHPPSLKFHSDTRHKDSRKPYRLRCIHLTHSNANSLSPPCFTELIGPFWGLGRDAYQWMPDLLGQCWEGGWWWWWGRRFKFRSLSAGLSSSPAAQRSCRKTVDRFSEWTEIQHRRLMKINHLHI